MSEPYSAFGALKEFVRSHGQCEGVVRVCPEPPTRDGYTLAATCRGCGANFECFVTPELARRDLVFSPLLVNNN